MNIVESIINAGIVGAGGAGFPTHEKLKKEVDYLIINAAECEPLLQSDQFIMRERSEQVVRGIEYVLSVVKAKKAVIGTKSKYKKEIGHLRQAIAKSTSSIELYLSDSFYPLGDEQILVQIITGRSIPAGGIPLDVSCVTLNVTTVSQIADAVEKNLPVTEKIVTVLGEVKNPGLICVPVGISLQKCIEACGGASPEKYYVIIGGPMMGKIINGADAGKKHITKTDGALIIIPEDHYLARRKMANLDRIIKQANTSCIQCRYCTDMCPRYLIGHDLQPHLVMRNVGRPSGSEAILKEALICCECGVCEMYACPMGLSPRMVNVYLKDVLRKKGVGYAKQTGEVTAKKDACGRRIPTDRLISRLCLAKYKDLHFESVRTVDAGEVTIYLKQHIGAPAKPVVKKGDKVRAGQLIGEKTGLGANVHSSISGVVCEVTDMYIKIILEADK